MASSYFYNVGSAFQVVAETHANRVALAFPDGRRISYGELNGLSDRIARVLRGRGLARHSVVAIFNDKSAEAFASMIACLKLGIVYTNLDITSPWARVEKMLKCCSPALVLHDGIDPEVEAGLASELGVAALALGGPEFLDRVPGGGSDRPDLSEVTGGDPAYIMFTSGSTGFPKGAVMSHANVLNFARWGEDAIGVTHEDVLTNVNPMYFDNSVFDFYVALLNGATLCPLKPDPAGRTRNLVTAINELGCTVWFSVPSFLVYLLVTKALTRDDFSSITRIVFGGEGFPKPKLAELYALFAHRARLINVYGPTECTCICSAYDISEHDLEDQTTLAPLGRIAPNFDYIIDPVDGADPDTGELCLGGPNVGLGYWRDPERTARAFVQDPTGAGFRRILYRTGDLVARDENGLLHFRGRADNQIKHMGYRIELEEIEAGLNTLAYVAEAAVVYVRAESGPGKIVAFVGADHGVSPKTVANEIRKVVPPYMVPKDIHVLPFLPKNRNGKIDRARLRDELAGELA